MGHLTDSNWWWDTALDGVVGAIIGGLVTVLVLVLTFSRERAMRERQEIALECARLLSQTRDVLTQMQDSDVQMFRTSWPWSRDLLTLQARVAKQEPCFAALLEASLNRANTSMAGGYGPNRPFTIANPQGAAEGLSNVEALLSRRIMTPRYFRMSKTQCAMTVEQIGQGAFL